VGLSTNTQANLQKSIANILYTSITPLKSLNKVDLKEWYTNVRNIVSACFIDLPKWNEIIDTLDIGTFMGNDCNPEKANKLFMFLSQNDVLPESIEDAQNKITHAPDSDGYLVLWKIIQENHPDLQDYSSNTIWPAYDNQESLNTYLLKLQSHTITEKNKGRLYGNMEFLQNIYSSLPTQTFKKTKLYIADALCDYSDKDPQNIPSKWYTQYADSTCTKYARRSYN